MTVELAPEVLPIIYLGSSLRAQDGDPGWPDDVLAFQANVRFAEAVAKRIALAGGVPYAPHLLFPRFFDDGVEVERNLALVMGQRMIGICDEAWFILPVWRALKGLSTGMKGERETAEKLGVPVRVCYDTAALDIQLRRLTNCEVALRRAA